VLVERGDHLRAIEWRRPAASPREPLLDAWPRGESSRLGAQQLGHADTGFCRAPGQAGVDVVIEVANLY